MKTPKREFSAAALVGADRRRLLKARHFRVIAGVASGKVDPTTLVDRRTGAQLDPKDVERLRRDAGRNLQVVGSGRRKAP